jgi:hypothetical protein
MRTDREHFNFAMEVLKPVVDDMSWASGIMFQSRIISIADASPLLLMWAYQAITVYRRLEQRYGDVVQEPLALMQEKLRIMSRRWKVGGMKVHSHLMYSYTYYFQMHMLRYWTHEKSRGWMNLLKFRLFPLRFLG